MGHLCWPGNYTPPTRSADEVMAVVMETMVVEAAVLKKIRLVQTEELALAEAEVNFLNRAIRVDLCPGATQQVILPTHTVHMHMHRTNFTNQKS